jgi:hypothetical protein
MHNQGINFDLFWLDCESYKALRFPERDKEIEEAGDKFA